MRSPPEHQTGQITQNAVQRLASERQQQRACAVSEVPQNEWLISAVTMLQGCLVTTFEKYAWQDESMQIVPMVCRQAGVLLWATQAQAGG